MKNFLLIAVYIILIIMTIFGYYIYLFIDWYIFKNACDDNIDCVKISSDECVNKKYAYWTIKGFEYNKKLNVACECSWYLCKRK